MYLERLELQGFKSFAQKTTLEFNRQLTAVVGPNGSGKSNIADAVRWVLGEQSVKLLRGKRAEDVIFAGSEQKSRLGMAEVSLYLNNADGSAASELSEVVVTRRVYRDGQSEYLLNRSPVRLQDIQILLARASFGQKTYSVIGQGMVDSILLTSPAERKEFFEEATGVKQYQLKREQAIQKLSATYENTEQAEALLREIDPRLKSLTRQVRRLERREEMERELRELQVRYYRARYHALEGRRSEVRSGVEAQQATLQAKQAERTKLADGLHGIEQGLGSAISWHELEAKQQAVREQLQQLLRDQARERAQAEVAGLKRGEGERVLIEGRRVELERELRELEAREAARATEVATLQVRLGRRSQAQERVVAEFSRLEEGGTDWLKVELASMVAEHGEVRRFIAAAASLMEARAAAGKVAELEERLRQAAARLERSGKLSTGELERLLNERDQATTEVADLKAQLAALEREAQANQRKLTELTTTRERVAADLARAGGRSQPTQESHRDLDAAVTATEAELRGIEVSLADSRRRTQTQQDELIELQRQLESATREERQLESVTHELSLELARLETKLEDLNHEIVQEVPAELVHRITQAGPVVAVDEGETALQRLKHQFEQTSGIEPEVVAEYQQTKTRFDFLTAQLDDLTRAAGSLEEAIQELDRTIEQQFLGSFKLLNEKFGQFFKVLFSGGRAQLILQKAEVEEPAVADDAGNDAVENEGEPKPKPTARERFLKREKVRSQLFAGVEIQATPPGKKLSSITALSGGEKALTAIALISSIISNNPSPFVVLDEVDAALDEANSERYAAILDSLMDRTQFITITHNRATMRRADILYGVTMGEDGISRLLSVKFDQAEELAAKGGLKKGK